MIWAVWLIFDVRRNMVSRAHVTILLSGLLLALCSCATYEEIAAKRRERLLESYPPQITTREMVAARWAPIMPELSYTKPREGWVSQEPRYAGEHVRAREKVLKQSIASFERYYGPDGLLGLCRCWFYYDAAGRLIDAEWQYASD